MKITQLCAAALLAAAGVNAQPSPAKTESGTIGGVAITIKYSAPSVKGRQIFGEGGLVAKDRTAPMWRAGANSATSLHTEGDLDIGGLTVPKGDYTLFVNPKDSNQWELAINKQTGQWGLTYAADMDLGRVKMKMSKPPALVEQLKYTIAGGKITLEWENYSASVTVKAK